MFDGMQCFLQGLIRAMGLQKIASFFAIGSYYIVAIPAACMLSFWADYGVVGLQLGYLCAVVVQATAYLCILKIKSWKDVADGAAKRMQDEEARLAALTLESCEDQSNDGYTKQV